MGIALLDRHREPLGRRGRRAGLTAPADWVALLDAAEAGAAEAVQRLAGLVTTRHTGFFRHPEHFSLAAAHAGRAVKARGRARLWSAGTATGEEAWSLAMVMAETFPVPVPVEILATDLLEAALAAAERAEYDARVLQTWDEDRRRRFVEEGAGTGPQRLAPALRRLVRFQPLNLAAAVWPADGPFDVIFCRNVLMYLGPGARRAVLGRLAERLAPDGLLFLDPAEHPGPAVRRFVPASTAGAYVLASLLT